MEYDYYNREMSRENEPNSLNISENCGSTHIENLQKYVLENKLDVGLVFDGDT